MEESGRGNKVWPFRNGLGLGGIFNIHNAICEYVGQRAVEMVGLPPTRTPPL